MTDDPDAALVEAVARAMCRAAGADPEDEVASFPGMPFRWQLFRDDARMQIAAHRAIMAAERDGGRG